MDSIAAKLEALIDQGLTVSMALTAFAARQDPALVAYRDAVDTREGELEVDGNAIVSESEDGGAYVMAWVWVADRDL